MHLHHVFDTDDEAGSIYKWFLRKRDEVLKDNVVFFLHYHFTVALFFIGCLIVTVAMFIMDPIDCIADTAVNDVIDNYCLYHSTYTLAAADVKDNTFAAHPGVTSVTSGKATSHNYYLWVALMLAIQGVSFYIPRGLWKHWSGTRIENILKEKDVVFEEKASRDAPAAQETIISSDSLVDENGTGKRRLDLIKNNNFQRAKTSLVLYIISKSHYWYYWKLLFCEMLNLANSVLQLLVMNIFLGFALSSENLWYNENIIQLFHEDRPFEKGDIVEQMFPKVTACTFYSYGPSGSVINYQAVCVLPVNAINEKIYATLYVWLLFLIFVSTLAVAYRLTMLIPCVRNTLLKVHLRSDKLDQLSLSKLRKRLCLGNWQLLLQLVGNSNMDSRELTTVVKYLCEDIDQRKRNFRE